MSMRRTASLTDTLLIAKGAALPFTLAPARAPRQSATADLRPRISVRLDEAQHKRLRLAAAHRRISVHKALLEALDQYLDGTIAQSVEPSCVCLARRPSGDNISVLSLRTP